MDFDAAEMFRLHPIGLQRIQLPEHRLQLVRLHRRHRVRKDRRRHMIRNVGNRIRRQIRINDHHLSIVQQRQILRNVARRNLFADRHIIDGQRHITIRPAHKEIGRGAAALYLACMGDVNAQISAARLNETRIIIVTECRQHTYINTQQRHIMGNVSANAAKARRHRSRIGILRNQGSRRTPADIDVHTADNGHIGTRAKNISLAGDISLLHQIGNMDGCRAAADSHLLRKFLLRNHRIFFNQLQNLTLSLCHSFS